MKVIFFVANLFFGVCGLVLGGAVLLNAPTSVAAVTIGVVVIALAAICLGLCKDCLCSQLTHRTDGRG